MNEKRLDAKVCLSAGKRGTITDIFSNPLTGMDVYLLRDHVFDSDVTSSFLDVTSQTLHEDEAKGGDQHRRQERRQQKKEQRRQQQQRRQLEITKHCQELGKDGSGEDERLYDTDLEDEETDETAGESILDSMRHSRETWHLVDAGRIIRQLKSHEVALNHTNIGDRAVRLLAAEMKENECVEYLQLREAGMTGEGMLHLADALFTNRFITYLDVSNNRLGTLGAHAIGCLLLHNHDIQHLQISGCDFHDRDGEILADGITLNERVTYINLSNNGFSEIGAQHIGKALGKNISLQYLDLSWNKIRLKGAVDICKGIQRSPSLAVVNLSWNGFGYEGAFAVGAMLRKNSVLRELDISSNRIDWKCVQHIAKALKQNNTLTKLMIGHNPLMLTGCLDLMEAAHSETSSLAYLGLQGLKINWRISNTAEKIENMRPFSYDHSGFTECEDAIGRREVKRGDPLVLLLDFLDYQCLRPVDLFRYVDKETAGHVTRLEFIQGLKKVHAPLTDYEMRQLVETMETDGKGLISYISLVEGMRSQRLENRVTEKRRQLQEKRTRDGHRRIMDVPLPPITQAVSQEPTVTSLSRHGSVSSSVPSIFSLLLQRGATTIPPLSTNRSKVTSPRGLRHKSMNAIRP